jgi:hypothetical protein
MITFGKVFPHSCIQIITTDGGDIMGIHYDYKSTRGAKKLAKQQEREQRRRLKKDQQMPSEKPDESQPLTLDMITTPDK